MTQHGARGVGTVFNKPKLLRLLTNATYVGRVEDKQTIYPGEQAAILEPEKWEEINAALRSARRGTNHIKRTKQSGLLTGLLVRLTAERALSVLGQLDGSKHILPGDKGQHGLRRVRSATSPAHPSGVSTRGEKCPLQHADPAFDHAISLQSPIRV
jgi:hypothetical protein